MFDHSHDSTLSAVTKVRLLVRTLICSYRDDLLLQKHIARVTIKLEWFVVCLQDDMLGGLKVEGTWSILLLDSFTTQIMTNICGVSDLLDYGVSCT